MFANQQQIDEVKRRLRKLKKIEAGIRYSTRDLSAIPQSAHFTWDTFFDLHTFSQGNARYSCYDIMAMDRDTYQKVIDEYFAAIYYSIYKERGIPPASCYDPDLLAYFGLPYDAGEQELKKRFRELAVQYHPDTGGDAGKFIELMEKYHQILDK